MTTTILTEGEGIDWPSEFPARPEGPASFSEGERATFLVMGNAGPAWSEMRFGIYNGHQQQRLLGTAREESLETTEMWFRLINLRCAVPVFGNTWRKGSNFWLRQPGWALGFYKRAHRSEVFTISDPFGRPDEGGAALISEQDGERRRIILVDGATADRWLQAKQWEVKEILRDALRLGDPVES